MALVGCVLLAQGEGHEGGDVSASVVGAAGDETGGCVEVDGAGLAVVLRREVREDSGKGLAPLLHGWDVARGSRSDGGARRSGDNAGCVGVVTW